MYEVNYLDLANYFTCLSLFVDLVMMSNLLRYVLVYIAFGPGEE
jgi:hypothetical protein